MTDKCPKCGAEIFSPVGPVDYRLNDNRFCEGADSPMCLRRQLEQSQARVNEFDDLYRISTDACIALRQRAERSEAACAAMERFVPDEEAFDNPGQALLAEIASLKQQLAEAKLKLKVVGQLDDRDYLIAKLQRENDSLGKQFARAMAAGRREGLEELKKWAKSNGYEFAGTYDVDLDELMAEIDLRLAGDRP